MIFVNSMSDLFHESLPDAAIAEVFRAMSYANWHTYQILTKRAARMAAIMPRIVATFGVMPHVWLGVSAEDRANLSRICLLRQTPSRVRFLSLEPLLEDLGTVPLDGVDLAIVGGESGAGARVCNLDWIRSIVRQCAHRRKACFVKQAGSHAYDGGVRLRLVDSKGGNPAEWPEDVRVRELPEAA